jgi:peptidoglycan/xylan/chitin deacetylase (PgdA/CDA1 family)
MDFVDWYKKRGFQFILKRAQKLRERYSFTPQKSVARILDCVEQLLNYDCSPTFFVPGIVVKRNSDFIRELQEKGCEIGVHSYQHVDLRSISPQEANRQLEKANEAFRKVGLKSDGFRCPYLSISDGLLKVLSPGLFKYSSNRAIAWVNLDSSKHQKNKLFDIIGGFYHPALAQNTLSLPYFQENILEIPVSVPDDLQMRDGLNYTPDQISTSLLGTFKQIHQRGELFNLLFHPELASLLNEPFVSVLGEVQEYKNRVWITQLRDVATWWNEKEDYKIQIERSKGEYHIELKSPHRATVLHRGMGEKRYSKEWDGKYQMITEENINITNDILPFVGVSPGLPDWVSDALDRKGYITVSLKNWEDCSVKITDEFIGQCANPVELIAAIENLDVPLVRFWPWPDGNRSALCLSGDLDALSLMDYATRLLPTGR